MIEGNVKICGFADTEETNFHEHQHVSNKQLQNEKESKQRPKSGAPKGVLLKKKLIDGFIGVIRQIRSSDSARIPKAVRPRSRLCNEKYNV
ncbi:hypothetical protein NPIL_318221 [Nephila pilipes]|uniref:Uncharacterized protein n=1 Tax=Nephila pilipes TaxID=299642 RepID=A0A8X6PKR5_NEPPI|nr:hypothetical protein NPIL_318221 [Nephila pilipes]